ncbi:MAG: tryptophan synthase subunit beta [Immundisolibacter sp.]|uniref:tryptophan synthase subunit beta n=1 Tax=Immundisolibacter sp. TaxID=1934948 RepID=UPI003D13CC47
MFYVQRGADGKVSGVSAEPPASGEPPLPANHPDVLEFLLRHGDQETTAAALAATDTNLARVVEDLVSLLADRGVILFTDLPDQAQRKLLLRGRLRSRLGDGNPLVDGEDAIL